MHYEELKTFVTLAEVKNFTKTAEVLLMSQPSVSLHIKNLENEFQTRPISQPFFDALNQKWPNQTQPL